MRRVVITGTGMVSPLGCGTEVSWSRLIAGHNGARLVTEFEVEDLAAKIACRIPFGDGTDGTFNADDWMEPKEQRKVDPFIIYGMAAADMALADAEWHPATDEDQIATGVMIGSGIGGLEGIVEAGYTLRDKGPRRISPFFIPASIINLAAGQVSIRLGARGPNLATCTACTASAHAIGEAFEIIRRGDADIMIAGGSEAAITPMGVGGFAAMRALSTRNDEPDKASRPFDKDRDGFVMGEGAGICILETLESARQRGAPVYCELVGYGLTSDAYHLTGQPEEAHGAIRSMRMALKKAGIAPEKVDYINAHGTSTPINDPTETLGVKSLFGEHAYKLAMSSTKSMTGHLLGAAGGLEAGITALAVKHQIAPPTVNLDVPDPACDLDYVPHQARPMKIDYALSNSFGFGGTNGTLLMKRFED